MSGDFLEILKSRGAAGANAGDEFGGAASGTVNPCGLYDLERRPRPAAAAYRQILEESGQISLVPHAELLAVSAEPARLKTDI